LFSLVGFPVDGVFWSYGIDQQIPIPPIASIVSDPVRYRKVLGGIYYREAAQVRFSL
jgi:hypothetical protein